MASKRSTTKRNDLPRDRVTEMRRVPAGQLRDHPVNWRTHPKEQKAVMADLLGSKGVGYVKPVDAYIAQPGDSYVVEGKLNAGDVVLMDGHLRTATLPKDFMVPVNITDLNEAEARLYLATCDPLGALAETDEGKLCELLEGVETDSAAVQAMLGDLIKTDDGPSVADSDDGDSSGTFQIIIHCKDEDEQRELIGELLQRGIDCKSLIG